MTIDNIYPNLKQLINDLIEYHIFAFPGDFVSNDDTVVLPENKSYLSQYVKDHYDDDSICDIYINKYSELMNTLVNNYKLYPLGDEHFELIYKAYSNNIRYNDLTDVHNLHGYCISINNNRYTIKWMDSNKCILGSIVSNYNDFNENELTTNQDLFITEYNKYLFKRGK